MDRGSLEENVHSCRVLSYVSDRQFRCGLPRFLGHVEVVGEATVLVDDMHAAARDRGLQSMQRRRIDSVEYQSKVGSLLRSRDREQAGYSNQGVQSSSHVAP